MDCPFWWKKGVPPEDVQPVCTETLHDLATNMHEMYVPGFLHHLIQRPLQHFPIAGDGCGNVLRGMVIMEFNKQIFRQDISVARYQKCPCCGTVTDPKGRYAQEVDAAVKKIARDVNIAVRALLSETLARMPETP